MPRRLRTAAIIAALLTTAPASAHVGQALQGPADLDLGFEHTGDKRIVNEAVINVMVIGADARPSAGEKKGSFATSQLAPVPNAPFCRGGIASRRMPWIRLTGPSGNPIHVNVEQITSVRSDTDIPGARAQLDLSSGKFQGVQENVEQIMRLISATSGACENNEAPSEALIR
jgi:hypothetical protein